MFIYIHTLYTLTGIEPLCILKVQRYTEVEIPFNQFIFTHNFYTSYLHMEMIIL